LCPNKGKEMRSTHKELKFVAELGILKTIPDFLEEPLKPGRLKRIFIEIDSLINIELKKIVRKNPTFYKDNKSALAYYLNQFGKEANWIGKGTHVASVISFCLAFLEVSNYKYPDKLFELLNDAVDYFERVGNIEQDDLFNAENFINVWTNIPDYEWN
jgi:hypothetical protein